MITVKNFALFSCSLCCLVSGVEALDIVSIPQPRSVTDAPGQFNLSSTATIAAGKELHNELIFLGTALKKFGMQVKTAPDTSARFVLKVGDIPGKEAYKLTISPRQVIIRGSDPAGVFYGIQTLLQQMEDASGKGIKNLDCGIVEDSPRYGWRGFMLDEARHFFGKEKVLQILDNMAKYKLNKFHWHLTDEPGWRMEIKKYPKLATVGGQGSWSRPNDKNVRYYTQAEIRDIIKYATDRHIEIIPEIDMPGHATAANKAYPEYSGGGTKDHPEYTFNPGKEQTYSYLTDILQEVAHIFPSPYIHLGGDEVAFASKSWDDISEVQQLKEKEKLKSNKDVERYFVHRMTDNLNKKIGKTAIGWDEMLEVHAPQDQTILMWWRHDRVPVLKKALEAGYRTILSPRRPLYFDFTQHQSHKWGRTWNGFCPLQDVYEFPDKGLEQWKIPSDQQKLIMGVQANVWTERIDTPKRLDFMIWPRLCAVAESGWTAPEVKNYDNFRKRMENAYASFDKQGIYYFDERDPSRTPEPVGCNKDNKVIPMDFRD